MRSRDANPARAAWLVVVGLVVFMLALAGCGGGSDSTSSSSDEALQKLGKGEGEVNLISWAGYVEPGWSKPFEQKTGCNVNNKEAGTSDEMVELMKTGQYDGVSASGNATARLVAANLVAPVNTDLVPNYKTVFADLKDQPYNTFEGVNYGIPHGRGANLLMWNGNDVKPAPDSWNVMFDPKIAAKYKGKISVYDESSYIADAAMYLKFHQPDLGIENPYELNEEQFNAAIDLLKTQNTIIGEYWSDYLKAQQAFDTGDTVLGTTWQIIANYVQADKKVKVQAVLPSEGATGWSDTWMVATKSKHKTCAYKWMDHIISPKVNAEVAEWFGEAPANSKSCAETVDKTFCDTFHADDEAYFDQVWYWNTPIAQCLDGRTDATCKDYGDWTTAWQEIKG